MIDAISLIAGIIVATVVAIVVYTQRHRIASLRTSVASQASATRHKLTRSAAETYREAVIELANGLHLAGHLVPLEQIAVVPKFFTLPKPFDPLEEENPDYDRPDHLLPLVPDWPQVIAPYQIPATALDQVLRGDCNIALLGEPGSGRTTTLAMIALLLARQTEKDQPGGLLSEVRLPIYFHLDDVNLDPSFYGIGADPLYPMMEAARIHLRGLAGRLLPAVQSEFASGQGVILADGWDETSPAKRQRVVEWLRVVMETYPGNKLVVAGPLRGYAPLRSIGLTPVFMMPWSSIEHAEAVRLWTAAWPEIGGKPKAPAATPSEEVVRRAARGNRALTALDVTLHLWATFAEDDPGEERLGWYRAYVKRVLPAPELAPALYRLGQVLLERPGETGLPIDQMTAIVDTARDTLHGRASMSTPDFIYAVTAQTHLLAERADGRIAFNHPVVGAYLTAEALRGGAFRESLLSDQPMNDLVMPFLARMQDITPYVNRRLSEPNTILQRHLLSMAAWAAAAEASAPWRGAFFKRLGALLLGPSVFPAMRERAMAALVASRDPNAAYIFREGLASSDPRLRALCAFGLGALGDTEAVLPLGQALQDEDITVEVAASLALGAVGTKPALDYLIQELLSGNDLARRGVAEILAMTNAAGEGHDIVREAAAETDPATRKAAVYGLQRVGQDWAIEIVAGMERRDDNWSVRAVAADAMDRHRAGTLNVRVPPQLPRIEETAWFSKWLAERNATVAPGEEGFGQLIMALREGDDAIRLAAAEMLAALGGSNAVRPLYEALRDQHPEIRDAAYRALSAVCLSSGYDLPGVM